MRLAQDLVAQAGGELALQVDDHHVAGLAQVDVHAALYHRARERHSRHRATERVRVALHGEALARLLHVGAEELLAGAAGAARRPARPSPCSKAAGSNGLLLEHAQHRVARRHADGLGERASRAARRRPRRGPRWCPGRRGAGPRPTRCGVSLRTRPGRGRRLLQARALGARACSSAARASRRLAAPSRRWRSALHAVLDLLSSGRRGACTSSSAMKA